MLSTGYMLFRFPFKEFLWQKIILSVLLATFSYFVRDITVVNIATIIVPLTYLITFTLFITLLSKIRILWASVITVTGYSLVGTIQMILLIVFDAFGVQMAEVQEKLFFLFIVQALTAVIGFLFSFLYYYRGAGFTYEFPSWRRKHLWLVLVEVILIALILRFVFINNLSLVIAVSITLAALLFLSQRMEMGERVNELES